MLTPEHATPTQQVIAEIDDAIARLQHLKAGLHARAEFLNGQIAAASLGLVGSTSVYFHDVKEPRALCRLFGGDWEREHNSRGGFNYVRKRGEFEITIFDAEKALSNAPLVL